MQYKRVSLNISDLCNKRVLTNIKSMQKMKEYMNILYVDSCASDGIFYEMTVKFTGMAELTITISTG